MSDDQGDRYAPIQENLELRGRLPYPEIELLGLTEALYHDAMDALDAAGFRLDREAFDRASGDAARAYALALQVDVFYAGLPAPVDERVAEARAVILHLRKLRALIAEFPTEEGRKTISAIAYIAANLGFSGGRIDAAGKPGGKASEASERVTLFTKAEAESLIQRDRALKRKEPAWFAFGRDFANGERAALKSIETTAIASLMELHAKEQPDTPRLPSFNSICKQIGIWEADGEVTKRA